MPRISIIIPIYNEGDNIHTLFERIHRCIKKLDYEIIVVDDNSTDGTVYMIEELSNEYPVKLIIRKNDRGLAKAVVEGFKNATGDIFIVMDADLQHPPEKMIALIDEIDKGSDIVIGSRYIQRNGFEEFSLYRKIISRSANILAKTLFNDLRKITEIQSGFFALKRNVIDGIMLDPIGYSILLEILIVGNYNNVREIGYEFFKRENGNSKLGPGIIIDYIIHLMKLSLRKGELKRFIKYCIIGAIGILINTSVLFILTTFGIFYIISSVIAHEISIIINFIMNDRWTFKDLTISNRSHSFFIRAIHYNWTRVSGVLLSISLLYILTEFTSINYIISNMISIMIGVGWGYFTAITIIWRD